MIPGRRNRVLLDASQPGVYRGQCSQFCGFQHAHMACASSRSRRRPSAPGCRDSGAGGPPVAPAARRASSSLHGRPVRELSPDPGTPGRGIHRPGTHPPGDPPTLAGNTIPNTPAWLARWIHDPQAIKPGDRMPDRALAVARSTSIVAYLESCADGDVDRAARPARRRRLERVWVARPGILGWLTTVDHKRIGIMYFFAAPAPVLRRWGRGDADAHPADRPQRAPAVARRPTTRCSRSTGSR